MALGGEAAAVGSLNDDVEPLFPTRVMAGVRPLGRGMHVGHFFGAARRCVQLQHEYPGETFCVLADYHALTATPRPETLLSGVHAFALDYLALGLDPSISTLYRQSDVPQVCELMWILACATSKARLDRAHVHREAVIEPGAHASIGEFLYPALLAADVLALRTTDVSLGDDQAPALEIVRDIGRAFNHLWGTVFPLPRLHRPAVSAPPGLDERNMSASPATELSVFWRDDRALEAHVMHIVTGSVALGEPIEPDDCSIYRLYRLLVDDDTAAEMRDGLLRGRLGYRDAKRMLLGALREYFRPYRERRRRLEADSGVVEDVLKAGAGRVREEAEATLDAVRESVGLGCERRRFV